MKGAQRIAVPVGIAADVFSIGSTFHDDGNRIGDNTKQAVGGAAGGWAGAFAGAKGGAIVGGTIDTAIPIPGVGTAVGGVVCVALGARLGGSWLGEKLGGLF